MKNLGILQWICDIAHEVHHQNRALDFNEGGSRVGFSVREEFDGGRVAGLEFGGGRGPVFECLGLEDSDEAI
jgi:hypothetical protein